MNNSQDFFSEFAADCQCNLSYRFNNQERTLVLNFHDKDLAYSWARSPNLPELIYQLNLAEWYQILWQGESIMMVLPVGLVVARQDFFFGNLHQKIN